MLVKKPFWRGQHYYHDTETWKDYVKYNWVLEEMSKGLPGRLNAIIWIIFIIVLVYLF